jgi:hypothetical protein
MLTAVRTKKFTPKPAAPEIDPRFQNVKAKVGQKAAQIKKHPPAKLKAEEAAKAAKAPLNEKQAGAKEKQTDLMKAAKAEKVEPDNFRALLRAEIKKVMPETLDDADSFMEGGKQEQMKGAVSGKVSEQKNTAESQIKTTAKQKPNTAGVPVKEVKDLPETPPTPVPFVNAAEAMPVPRTDAEVSQKQSKSDADQQFKDAQITTKQLKKADEPRFTAVLDAKKEVETVADASPAKYRAQEKALLGQTAARAQSDGRRNLFALAGVKTKSGAAVKSRQLAAKAKDEKARKEVTDNIEAMYNTTKMLVEMQLSTLETTVFSMFDSGSAAAIAAMKADTTREIDDYKDDRYSGIRGKARWVADLFRATPKGIVKIIEKNLQVFKAAMDSLIDRVANTVETRLQQAKDEIDKGQAKIKKYVSTLKGKTLQDIGKAAEKEVAGRFDEMRAGVEDRKNVLAQKLAESYKAAIDKGNALASELEAENEGAAYKLAKKIAEIAQLILDFKDKLVAILKKAVSVILDILADPIGFFGNLIDALKQGFSQFTKNFADNFKEAIAKWLFGNLGGEGFELPKDLSAPSILKLVMGVAGLTYNKIRGKAVKLIGERNVALLEKLYEYLKILFTGGADALWTEVKKDFGNLQETVISGIKSWLMTALVEAGIKKLLTMFIPGGGFVQAALAIYKIVVFIVERAAQIADFISSIVDSVADIVSGSISAAASRIEKALIQALALIIDLLARIIGLSGIAQTIKSLIKKFQDKVEKAIDFVIAKVVQTVKKLFGKSDKKEVSKTDEADVELQNVPFSMTGAGHTLSVKKVGGKIKIFMASDEGTLSGKLDGASKEIERRISGKAIHPADGQRILTSLKGLKAAASNLEEKINAKPPPIESKLKSLQETFGKLALIVQRLGASLKISELKDAWKFAGEAGTENINSHERMMLQNMPNGPNLLTKIDNEKNDRAKRAWIEEARIALDAKRRGETVTAVNRDLYRELSPGDKGKLIKLKRKDLIESIDKETNVDKRTDFIKEARRVLGMSDKEIEENEKLTEIDVETQKEIIQVMGERYDESDEKLVDKHNTQLTKTVQEAARQVKRAGKGKRKVVVHLTNFHGNKLHDRLIRKIKERETAEVEIEIRLGRR